MFESTFDGKQKVAYLISKVYYHLEEYEESVEYALESGPFFDLKNKTVFVDCIVSKGLDSYIKQCQDKYDHKSQEINVKTENLFERIFQNSIEQKSFKSAIGISLEARRLDKITVIFKNQESEDLLNYLYEITIKYTHNRSFKH